MRTPVKCLAHDVPRVYFVSDLHIFCRRFDGERSWAQVAEVARGATTLVLGGDIFDFRWTALATIEETVEAAIDRLRSLVVGYPACMFHYLLGNHDHHEAFLPRLTRLANSESNLAWHPYCLRLGTRVFLHGDAATRSGGAGALEAARYRWLQRKKEGQIANWLYDAMMAARVHKLVYYAFYPKRAVARRLLAYLEQIGHGPATGVADVYFGHTHVALSGFQYGGVRFHNGGAPVTGCRFHILEAVASAP